MVRWATAALLAAALLVAGCARDEASRALESVTAEAVSAQAQFLASDLLEGREPGSRGGELAAAYIASQFETAGLEAAGGSGYLQPVPLVAIESQASLSLRAGGGASFSPEYGDEFVAWSEDTAQAIDEESELVFVGYGIAAAEEQWDDFKGDDVSGKFLLMLAGDPGHVAPGRFGGDTLTYYGFPRYKYEEAARRGARGAIIIHTADVGYGWDVVVSERTREQLWLQPDSGALPFEGWLSREAAEQVVSMAGLDFGALLESAGSPGFRPIPLGLTVTASIRNRVRPVVDANVAGLLRGGDPALADQYVIVSAHYDHLGIGPAEGSDSIYNGCYDNASGTAVLLAVADAFTRLERRPARSILFLAFTAQEPGMLGSSYYVAHPLVPLANTVAELNVDGANLHGRTSDVVALGAAQAGLSEAVGAAAEAEGLTLAGDGAPERGDLYASDQFSFMRRGVPGTLIEHGLNYIGRMPGWGKQMLDRYYERDYHQPSDECRADLDYSGAVQQARVLFRSALEVAEAPLPPRWEAGTRYRARQDSLLAGR